jgi:hypothetical protein
VKPRNLKSLLLGLMVLATSPAALQAQSYSIDWFKIAGGGGTSTGGTYQVSGTLGQPDAGSAMSGGNYSLTGGFWSLIAAVQTPGAPKLSITLTPTNVVILSWPYPSTGFSLEENPTLGMNNWTGTTNVPVQAGAQWQVPISPAAGRRFYRLKQ